jgi:DNA-binding protein HU-beta
LNKAELVSSVADKAEVTKKEAEKIITAVFDVVEEALAKGEKVQLVGFGTFEVRDRAARTGRNPQTGEEIQIAATRVPAFRAGKALRDSIG